MLGVQCRNTPALYTEWEDWETGSRFDHVVDDHRGPESYRSVLVIEDKIDAQLGADQLDRYCEFLAGEQGGGTLLVLHPERNPLTTEKLRIPELEKAHRGVKVRFMTWTELSTEMVTTNPTGAHSVLWQALAEFAESVGTGDIAHLPPAEVLLDPDAAAELRDLFLTMQAVADKVGHRSPRQLRFSFHKGNIGTWLQMGMSNASTSGIGLQLDLDHDPGTLLVGVHGPDKLESVLRPARIGVFPNGELSPAARRRVESLAEAARMYRSGGEDLLDEALRGRSAGSVLSRNAQDALYLLGAIFQAQAIRNPHRGGSDSRKTEGVNEGASGERLGARLVRTEDPEASIHLFVGRPVGDGWDRITVWIRDSAGEREIQPFDGESGQSYVLRVWKESRSALRG